MRRLYTMCIFLESFFWKTLLIIIQNKNNLPSYLCCGSALDSALPNQIELWQTKIGESYYGCTGILNARFYCAKGTYTRIYVPRLDWWEKSCCSQISVRWVCHRSWGKLRLISENQVIIWRGGYLRREATRGGIPVFSRPNNHRT